MPSFVTYHNFKLDFLGKDWKTSYIRFKGLTIGQIRGVTKSNLGKKSTDKIMDSSTKMMEDQFVEGCAYDSDTKEVIKLKKNQLNLLPSEVIEKALMFLVGDFNRPN